MKKKLQDYIHLYVGCDCKFKDEGGYEGIGKLTGNILNGIDMSVCDAIPILRPISDINEDDLNLGDFIPNFEILKEQFTGGYCMKIDSERDDGYCLTIYQDGSMYCVCKDNGENYPYKGGELFNGLLNKGFDLFGLIDAGLAIDKTTLK